MQNTTRIQRLWKHFKTADTELKQQFPQALLKQIEQHIGASESQHLGQVRLVLENTMPLQAVWHKVTARERAWYHFSHLKVWDTEYNTGVLLYIGWVDHAIEIVADRGISQKVPPQTWEAICQRLSEAFKTKRFDSGLQQALEEITEVLREHVPKNATHKHDNELSDEVILR